MHTQSKKRDQAENTHHIGFKNRFPFLVVHIGIHNKAAYNA
jgi:hypothetical protein